ncbi:MAG: sugar transferase [Anaerolineales bacterium]|nr:sugar transferase [Anaerolineales bacterium]
MGDINNPGNTTYLFIKRTMDILGALVWLIGTSWLYIPVMILVKLDSTGPVIFGQWRVGKEEKLFRCYKFRTMISTETENKFKPNQRDERVTRIGKFLRRWSIDETPQIWNVLKGDMSLVGPRPELPYFVNSYQEWQRRRFAFKPGLTGWWQVNGRKQPMHDHIDEDIYYVENASIKLDILILLRTAGAVLGGKGAI